MFIHIDGVLLIRHVDVRTIVYIVDIVDTFLNVSTAASTFI